MSCTLKGYKGDPILSFADWDRDGMPPHRRAKHWKEHHSAMELAKRWTYAGSPAVPSELLDLIDSHDLTKGTLVQSGVVEHRTSLPYGPRAPRWHDMSIIGAKEREIVTICVEGKATEPFGNSVANELKAAWKRPVTQFPDRLDWLTRSLFGISAFQDATHKTLNSVVSGLPYQLLTAVAGTFLQARIDKAKLAVFIVHEFRTPKTTDIVLDKHEKAFNEFLRLFFESNGTIWPGGTTEHKLAVKNARFVGPVQMQHDPNVKGIISIPKDIPLLIGKIRTDTNF